MAEITKFQTRCAEAVVRHGSNGSISTTALARRLRTSRLAVVSAMRSLERKGLASSFRFGRDEHASLFWGLAGELKERFLGGGDTHG